MSKTEGKNWMPSIIKIVVVMLGWSPRQGKHVVIWDIVNNKLYDLIMHSLNPCKLRVWVQKIGNIEVIQKN